ncbi:secondary metabolism regulator LAE1 [Colletotrichum spaethianum]|uniref:Secondary metabolism regulator LAE1 n=1 Tax=Colletotrichum spaethianum TaxID=700344 RepID=A0AA37NSR9_9PEZI|nr:secondary metabolism regulator LAE1 [Colletotrichum spaethianum]GKT40042.1 secondary metabolism regulator LAE1 [Colletotrichum spaethianum]
MAVAFRRTINYNESNLTRIEYIYPNDEKENDILDLQHNLFLLTTHYKLGLAPIAQEDSKVKRVLDVGTGTSLCVLPNVRFEVDDIEEPWTYHLPFGYIHTLAMTSSISDWKKFSLKCFDANLSAYWTALWNPVATLSFEMATPDLIATTGP